MSHLMQNRGRARSWTPVLLIALGLVVLAACSGDDAGAVPATPSAAAADPSPAATPATPETPAATVVPSPTPTATEPPTPEPPSVVLLPTDVCTRFDTDAIQELLGVSNVRLGSPSGTIRDQSSASCRFGVSYPSRGVTFGSAFNITLHAPSETAYDDALVALVREGRFTSGDDGAMTDGSPVDGVGVRAAMYPNQTNGPWLLVEFEGGGVAYAYAENPAIYLVASPESSLGAVMVQVVEPVLQRIDE